MRVLWGVCLGIDQPCTDFTMSSMRRVRLLYWAAMISAVLLSLWTIKLLLLDVIPARRPAIVTAGAGLVVLACLTLVAALSHALRTRQSTVDTRFLMVFQIFLVGYLLTVLINN